jgi:hypothetical protein
MIIYTSRERSKRMPQQELRKLSQRKDCSIFVALGQKRNRYKSEICDHLHYVEKLSIPKKLDGGLRLN